MEVRINNETFVIKGARFSSTLRLKDSGLEARWKFDIETKKKDLGLIKIGPRVYADAIPPLHGLSFQEAVSRVGNGREIIDGLGQWATLYFTDHLPIRDMHLAFSKESLSSSFRLTGTCDINWGIQLGKNCKIEATGVFHPVVGVLIQSKDVAMGALRDFLGCDPSPAIRCKRWDRDGWIFSEFLV